MGARVPDGAPDRIRALQQIDDAEIERRASLDPDALPATVEQLQKGQSRRIQADDAGPPKAGIAGVFSRLFGS